MNRMTFAVVLPLAAIAWTQAFADVTAEPLNLPTDAEAVRPKIYATHLSLRHINARSGRSLDVDNELAGVGPGEE